ILDDVKVVVTQPAQGDFKAFTAICTHQQCTVASVKKDKISCACHGSAYSAKDGSVINGPASSPLKPIAITVEGDQIIRS
ncbi:MAG: Rieske (2Fe-2S) protein, partial [Actinomycetes bacterium]